MLDPTNKKKFRISLATYCRAAELHQSVWHYSQRRPFDGYGVPPRETHENDCSSYVDLGFEYVATHLGLHVQSPLHGGLFNGSGNTDTAHAFLVAHHAPKGKYRIGDIALFLQREQRHHHMMVCRRAGSANTSVWSSFGSEGGPEDHLLHYRSDLTGVYRHPALL